MSVNMDAFSIDDDFEEPPIWSPFLDQTDLKVIAEALDFYLQSLDCRDPRVISVCSLIRNLRWGMRTDGCIMMLSGQDAAINWLPALALAQNVTRLDLAVTVSLADPITDVAKRAYAWVLTDPHSCPGKKRKYSYVENSSGGQTVYIGSRASDQFGRLYDKGCESAKDACAPPGLLWRYEVEFKAYRAKKLARQGAATPPALPPGQPLLPQRRCEPSAAGAGIRPLYT